MTGRAVKDAIRHRSPRLTAMLKTVQRRTVARRSPYGALDRAHEISAILSPGAQIQIDDHGVWLRDVDGCYWKHVPNVYGPFLGLERGFGFESREVEWANRYLSPGAVIIDVGANIGTFCVNVARHTEDTSVIALEPVGRTFDSLKANIARNSLADRVKPLRVAVAEEPGQVIITNGLNAANHVVPIRRARPSGGEELVRQMSLDELVDKEGLTRLDLVKIDVEGLELSVLKGAPVTLDRFRPVLMMEIEHRWAHRYEYDPLAIFALLGSLGYDHHCFTKDGLRHRSGDVTGDLASANNFVFVPQMRTSSVPH